MCTTSYTMFTGAIQSVVCLQDMTLKPWVVLLFIYLIAFRASSHCKHGTLLSLNSETLNRSPPPTCMSVLSWDYGNRNNAFIRFALQWIKHLTLMQVQAMLLHFWFHYEERQVYATNKPLFHWGRADLQFQRLPAFGIYPTKATKSGKAACKESCQCSWAARRWHVGPWTKFVHERPGWTCWPWSVEVYVGWPFVWRAKHCSSMYSLPRGAATYHHTPHPPPSTSEGYHETQLYTSSTSPGQLCNGNALPHHTWQVYVLPCTNSIWTIRHRKDHCSSLWFSNMWVTSGTVLLQGISGEVQRFMLW